jgi:signal transduction histidine kinase
MREDFVSMLSHDLRTPITSIQAFMTMLAEGLYDENLSGMKKKATNIERESDRLVGIINALLNVYKMEAGKLELFIDIVPCISIVDRSLQSVTGLTEKKKITITVDSKGISESDTHVRVDADYAVQVLVNLLSNSIKFSPPAEVIKITLETLDPFVKFSVTDRGPGIPAEFKTRLFNRFEQARISDARVKGGTGLGLAFARTIIDQCGGEIGVESEEGQGSTFWFTLPLEKLENLA